MQSLRRQKGLSGIGWLFVLALIAGGSLVTLKLLPVYMEDMSIDSVLKEVGETGESYSSSRELRTAILRRFDVNNIKRLGREDIVIDRDGGVYDVSIDYEVRIPFVSNIDLMLKFENHARVPAG